MCHCRQEVTNTQPMLQEHEQDADADDGQERD
jgi:hypothetical protein